MKKLAFHRAALICSTLLLALLSAPRSEAFQKTTPAASTAPSANDPLLNALVTELERSKEKLRLPDMQAPYFIEYRVFDDDEYSVAASFGAVNALARVHTRILSVTARVGDYKQDSYLGFGSNMVDLMPLENDTLALRHAIWLSTDLAYKRAVQSFAMKQAALRNFQEVQPVDDFSHEPPLESIANTVTLDLGDRDWPKLMESVSGMYTKDPQLDALHSMVRFAAVNRYLVNTEGTRVRRSQAIYQLNVSMTTQAVDGMRLARAYGKTRTDVHELPSYAEITRATGELIASLQSLRQAPPVKDEYRGPVLFSPDASASVINELVADSVTGVKPRPGSNQRTEGDYGNSYKGRVFPDFVTIIDDPSLTSYRDHALIGGYAVDDEGVKAQTVTLVDKGVLVNYLIGRAPIRDFPQSNGHGRIGFSAFGFLPEPHVSNLIVQSSTTVQAAEMKKKLIETCRQRGLPFGYYVETMASPISADRSAFGESNRSKDQSDSDILAPRLLYKVFVSDGHEELVRGAEFGELDTRALRTEIVAMGDDLDVRNSNDPMPYSIVSPSILFDELEVKESEATKEKLPQYPAPVIGAQ